MSSILTYGTISKGLFSEGLTDEPYKVRRGTIYFIQSHASKLIKIGYTTDLDARFKALQNQGPDFLVVLLHGEGSRNTEGEIHKRFSHLREQGEWFRPGEDLLEAIQDVRAKMGPERVLMMDHTLGLQFFLWQVKKMRVPAGQFYGGFEANYD